MPRKVALAIGVYVVAVALGWGAVGVLTALVLR